MSKSQREKGKAGEREVAQMLRSLGFSARRTAQYAGNTGEAADVIGVDGIHLEVKRQETVRIHDWMAQAEHDCGDKVPVVVHRRSRERWLVTLPAIDFFQLVKEAQGEDD